MTYEKLRRTSKVILQKEVQRNTSSQNGDLAKRHTQMAVFSAEKLHDKYRPEIITLCKL
jgi:hypothetical protein